MRFDSKRGMKMIRRLQEPGKTEYKDSLVPRDDWRRVAVNPLYESYIIIPQEETDISQYWILVQSLEQVRITIQTQDHDRGFWQIEFPLSKDHSQSPATVNITVVSSDDKII